MVAQPCPCGYYTDPARECTRSPHMIAKYMAKISGPLLDRIDLHIEVPAVKYRELSSKENGETSTAIRTRVIEARAIQTTRFQGRKDLVANADMQANEIREFCRLDAAGEELLRMAITKLGQTTSGRNTSGRRYSTGACRQRAVLLMSWAKREVSLPFFAALRPPPPGK